MSMDSLNFLQGKELELGIDSRRYLLQTMGVEVIVCTYLMLTVEEYHTRRQENIIVLDVRNQCVALVVVAVVH